MVGLYRVAEGGGQADLFVRGDKIVGVADRARVEDRVLHMRLEMRLRAGQLIGLQRQQPVIDGLFQRGPILRIAHLICPSCRYCA